ncbi:MAG TPA: J domain-containing protein [Bryobacteraceae bacterium]|jgi:curved DNA-binding protein CbpA
MNYYEELGVRQDATGEEIRQAYKALSRLLHPDAQADEKLKDLAGRQMTRLNQILEMLMDPRSRREYDASLRAPAPVITVWDGAASRAAGPHLMEMDGVASVKGLLVVQAAVRNWFWALIVTVGIVTFGIWWSMPRALETSSEVLPVRPSLVPRRVTVLPRGDARGRGPAGGQESAEERRPAQAFVEARLGALSPELPFLDPVTSMAGTAPARRAANPEIPPAKPQLQDGPTSPSPFVGNWLYVPRELEAADPGAYPAVYVELAVSEQNGDLSGNYFAQYKVPDWTIPPTVLLRVRGRSSSAKSARVDWTSKSGAKGVLEMTLRSPGVMNVAWWTIGQGRQPELTAGTASLIRQMP